MGWVAKWLMALLVVVFGMEARHQGFVGGVGCSANLVGGEIGTCVYTQRVSVGQHDRQTVVMQHSG